jgi:hypothetical protein
MNAQHHQVSDAWRVHRTYLVDLAFRMLGGPYRSLQSETEGCCARHVYASLAEAAVRH